MKKLEKTKDLNTIEFTLLSLIINYLTSIENCKESIIRCINDDKLIEAKQKTDEYNVLKRSNHLRDLQKAFFDEARFETLSKIINGDKFTPEYSFLVDTPIIIPVDVLNKMSQYDKVAASHPKAKICKFLGATIVA